MAIAIESARQQSKWTSTGNVVLGLWLIVAPFLLGYSGLGAAMWNDIIVGALIAVLAGIRVGKPLQQEGISWTNVVLGIWLIVAPFILDYGTSAAGQTATRNDIIVGILVGVLATWSGLASKAGKNGTAPRRVETGRATSEEQGTVHDVRRR